MKSKIYSDLEVESLEKSPFVLEVRRKRFIHYDPLFKLWTILQRKNIQRKLVESYLNMLDLILS